MLEVATPGDAGDDERLSAREAADLLGVGLNLVYEWRAAGFLSARADDGGDRWSYYFLYTDLVRFDEQLRAGRLEKVAREAEANGKGGEIEREPQEAAVV